MSDQDFLTLERTGHVAILTMNRPAAFNSLCLEMRHQYVAMLREVQLDDSVRVLVITGNGKAFCSGADLKEGMADDIEMSIIKTFAPIMQAIRSLDKVVISAINGVAAGIGVAIVTSSDLAVMSEDAYMQLAFSKIALLPDGGLTWDFVRAVGHKRAYRMMIEASNITPAECLEYGFVNEVVPAAEVLPFTLQWAEKVAELSPVACRVTKRALHGAADMTINQATAFEASLQQRAGVSEDSVEGINAFLEKRKPIFPGR